MSTVRSPPSIRSHIGTRGDGIASKRPHRPRRGPAQHRINGPSGSLMAARCPTGSLTQKRHTAMRCSSASRRIWSGRLQC